MGQSFGIGNELKFAELAQLPHDVERFVGILEHLRLGPEDDGKRAKTAIVVRFEIVDANRNEFDLGEVGGRRAIVVAGSRVATRFADQLLQRRLAVAAIVGRDGIAVADEPDDVGEHVARRQQHRDHSRRGAQVVAPYGIEHRLEDVRKADQPVEPEDPGATFDRVNGAKDRVYGLLGATRIAHIAEPGFDLLQQLAAFIEEGISQLV